MKKVYIALSILMFSLLAHANRPTDKATCSYVSGPQLAEPKAVCSSVVSKSINAFYSSGWKTEEDLIDAKLCIYDSQLFGLLDPSSEDMGGKDKPVTVRLVVSFEAGEQNDIYNRHNVLAADADAFESPNRMEVFGRSWQPMSDDDDLFVDFDPKLGVARYFLGLNSYFSITSLGFKYKAHVDLEFNDCEIF